MKPTLQELASPLIGVVASPVRVEAGLVERTPFGRFRGAGRRVVEDVDGPMEYIPLPVERQLAGIARAPGETRAGQAWVETIANAVAKLTFGVRGGPPRLGLALDAELDGTARSVVAARSGARVDDLVGSLEAALRGRNIELAKPIGRALTVGEAWTAGEMESALGGLAGVQDALALVWDSSVSWARVARGRLVSCRAEPPGSAHDLGPARLEAAMRRAAGEGGLPRVFVGARRGDPRAMSALRGAAEALGVEAGRRLLGWPNRDEGLHPDPAPQPDRLVLGGLVGRLALDDRLRSALLEPFEGGLARELLGREDAAQTRVLLSAEEGPGHVLGLAPGLVQVSQEDAAALIGAAASAARDS